MTWSLRSRYILSTLAMVIPLAAMTVGLLLAWTFEQQNFVQSTAQLQAQSLATALERSIQETKILLTMVAEDPDLTWRDPQRDDHQIAHYLNKFSNSPTVSLVSLQGQILAPADRARTGVTVGDREWFQRALGSNGFVIGQFVTSRVTGRPTLPMALGVRRKEGLVGVVVSSINLEAYYDSVRSTAGPDWVITVFDPLHQVLMRYPQPEEFSGKNFAETELGRVEASHRAVQGVWVGLDGVRRYYAIQPLAVDGVFVATLTVGMDVARATGDAQGWQLVVWILTITVFLLVFIVSLWGVRSQIIRPLSTLRGQFGTIAAGEFGKKFDTARLPAELAVIGEAANSMNHALMARDREIQSYQQNLESMVEQRTAELEASRTELIRSNAELQQFAYVASHDLQEPLRMVASFSQLLARKYGDRLDEQGRRYIDFAVDGATRMQTLINDLLTYSRVQTQTQEFESVDSTTVVRSALLNLKILIEERGVDVQLSTLPWVTGDSGQLIQLFQNLIGNGIKFNKSSPPRIWVSAREDKGLVEFRVEDNGIGISEEFGERVFVIFQRLNPRGEFGGNGIGLAVCKRIVERHGGNIHFERRQEGGTAFVFTLRPGKSPKQEAIP